MTKLLLIGLAAIALANSLAGESSKPPMLIDKAPAATPLHVGN
ncbi:MAG TPA: hypothetical protein VFK28_00425 [Sphingomicrobium sp.]|nr:hypothetical protein [Sphingomicrobium sp.]